MTAALAAVAIVASVASVQSNPRDAGQGILIWTTELIPARLQSVAVTASIEGKSAEITLNVLGETAPGSFEVAAAMADRNLGSYSLPLVQVPKLDLSTAEYWGRVREGVVQVEIRFGDETECFANYDGRSRLTVQFESGRAPRAFVTDYPNCEPKVTELSKGLQ